MTTPRWSLSEADTATSSIDLAHTVGAAVGVPAVILDIAGDDDLGRWEAVVDRLHRLAVVTITATGPLGDVTGDVEALAAAVTQQPHAATVAVQLLRHLPDDPAAAFAAESLAYATLQSGPEHRRWLVQQGRRTRNDDRPRVRLDDGDPIVVELDRPRLHNLIDRQGRDELAHAFRTIALTDPGRSVVWRGAGPSFCAGGDPAEFGAVADPATAHLIRAAASPAPALVAIRDRLSVHVHGACVGAGIELAAQAARVVADPDTRFRLPELAMGLLPGVGGTWSIPRRIGRQRLLRWLLLDLELDAETARSWGLIDAIEPRS